MWLKQSTAASCIIGPILDSTGAEYASAVIGDLSISKNGGTLTAMASAATLTHIANGMYTLAMTTGNTDTVGRVEISCNKSTYQMPQKNLLVLLASVFDALITNATNGTGGLIAATAAVSAVAGYVGASGAAINGTNANTLSSHDPGATIGTSTLTQTQVTGGAYSIQSASAVLGDARIANLDATISSRGTSTLTQTQVSGGAYALNSASFAFNTAMDFTSTQKTSLDAAAPSVTVGDKTGFSLANGSIVTATFGVCDFTSTQKTSITTAATAATPTVTAGTVSDKTGYSLAANQHVIVDSGTVTTLTNLPAITTDWLTGIGADTSFVTKIQAGLSTYAGGDTSGTTTLLTRIVGTLASGTHNPQSGDTYAYLGTNMGLLGVNLTAADDAVLAAISALNNLSAVQVNAEFDAALADYDAPTNTEMLAAFTQIKGATWSVTDTLEAIRDRGDAAWITATGFSTHSAADVVTAMGTGTFLTAVPWNVAWDAEVQSECTDAINSYDPPTNAELTAALAGLNDVDTTEIVTAVLAGVVDTGVSVAKALEILAALAAGKVSASSAAGVTTLTYKKRDGSTTSFNVVVTESDKTRATTGSLA